MSLILKYDLGNPHRLPVGYTPLAYIESSGTLWIDTGWLPTGNTQEVNIHFIPTASLSSKSICGGQPASSAPRNFILHSGSYFYTADNYISCTAYNTINLKYHVRMTNNVNSKLATVTVNGTTTNYAYNTATLTTTYTYHLFTNNNGGNKTSQASSCKIYYCNIINNGSVFGEYIPAKRNFDGVIGMFDIVSQTFKTNAGTGAFIAGPEVVVLPYEYLQVEYLESSGIEYIDTGYLGKNLTKKEMDLAWLSTSGEQINGMYNGLLIAIRNNGKWCLRSVDSTTTITLNKFYKASVRIESSKHILNVDGTDIHNITLPITGDSNETIGCWNNTNGTSRSFWAKEKVRYAKFWNGTTLVRNMIPCYRRSDMKPGMYDTVNKVFYTNSGSGEFVLGPTVEESGKLLEYNQCTGLTNYVSHLTVGGRTTISSDNMGFDATFTSNDTYCFIHTKELMEGCTYTISCDVSGLPSGNYWDFRLWNSNSYSFPLSNGHCTMTFIVNTSTMNASSSDKLSNILWDDGGRSTPDNSSVIHVRNVKMFAGISDIGYGLPTELHSYQINSILTSTHFEKNRVGYLKLPLLPKITNGSVSFWLKFDSVKGIVVLGEKDDDSYYLGASSGGTGSWYHNKCGSSITAYVDGVVKTKPTADTNWHHVVFTGVNLSQWPSIYLNNYPTGNWNIDGCYHDFRVYDNVLTADEVLNIYKKGV